MNFQSGCKSRHLDGRMRVKNANTSWLLVLLAVGILRKPKVFQEVCCGQLELQLEGVRMR